MIEWVGKVTNGYLPSTLTNDIDRAIHRLEGREVVVSLKLYKKQRSLGQNGYYFGVVIPEILKQSGNDHINQDEFHEWLKEHVGHLVTTITLPDGTRDKVVRSSKTLTTVEWEEYMEKIRAWAAGFAIIVPMPNEHLLIDGAPLPPRNGRSGKKRKKK